MLPFSVGREAISDVSASLYVHHPDAGCATEPHHSTTTTRDCNASSAAMVAAGLMAGARRNTCQRTVGWADSGPEMLLGTTSQVRSTSDCGCRR